jgi:hypothetical protein
MTDVFQGAALVSADDCNRALDKFKDERNKFIDDWESIKARLKEETTVSKIYFVLAWKESKWDAVNRLYRSGWLFVRELAMLRLGFVTQEQYESWLYFDGDGYYAAKSVKQLTNNGTRDAYLNPEQAAFVNRWGK